MHVRWGCLSDQYLWNLMRAKMPLFFQVEIKQVSHQACRSVLTSCFEFEKVILMIEMVLGFADFRLDTCRLIP